MFSKIQVSSKPSMIRIIQNLFFDLGINVTKVIRHKTTQDAVNLNIGSSDYSIKNFINLDMPSNWYGKTQNRNHFIPFDATIDSLPFQQNTVSNIYQSHVIEHLPVKDVKELLIDCVRVLKPNGVIRICTPDAKFLWEMARFRSDFWNQSTFTDRGFGGREFQPDNFDFLTHEIASWSRFNSSNNKSDVDK